MVSHTPVSRPDFFPIGFRAKNDYTPLKRHLNRLNVFSKTRPHLWCSHNHRKDFKFMSIILPRRDFIKTTGKAAALTALAGSIAHRAFAGGNDLIQVALIGCGGRGTGAARDALNTKSGPIKLVAMADVFEDRLTSSFNELNKRFVSQLDVPEEHKFIGFDAYRKAMDCLKPGDVA